MQNIAVAALNSGRHALVEKPMAPSVTECDDMLEAHSIAARASWSKPSAITKK